MKTWCLRASLWVPRPPAEVFPFFADARNLGLLTPDWLSFGILTPMPVAMHEGTRIDYRLRLHGLPLRWQTRIARWEPPHAFADEQLRGPYAVWHHTHTFTPSDGGTVLGDEVRLRPKGGPLAPAVMALFVRRDVERIFRHRAAVMAERFGADPASATVRWIDAGRAPVVSAAAGGRR
ncbi:MAG: SRPBCC family protein [Planctomycetes bacterium]|nr:SRPBCC family protein [Planctomycetota bacterium]